MCTVLEQNQQQNPITINATQENEQQLSQNAPLLNQTTGMQTEHAPLTMEAVPEQLATDTMHQDITAMHPEITEEEVRRRHEEQTVRREVPRYQPESYADALRSRGISKVEELPEEMKNTAQEKSKRASAIGDYLRSEEVTRTSEEIKEFQREYGSEAVEYDHQAEMEKYAQMIDHAAKEAYASTLYYQKLKMDAEAAILGIEDEKARERATGFINSIDKVTVKMELFISGFYEKLNASANAGALEDSEGKLDPVHKAMEMALMASDVEENAAQSRTHFARCMTYVTEMAKDPDEISLLDVLFTMFVMGDRFNVIDKIPEECEKINIDSMDAVHSQMNKYAVYSCALTYNMLHYDAKVEKFGFSIVRDGEDPEEVNESLDVNGWRNSEYTVDDIYEEHKRDLENLQKSHKVYNMYKELKTDEGRLKDTEEKLSRYTKEESIRKANELIDSYKVSNARLDKDIKDQISDFYAEQKSLKSQATLARLQKPTDYAQAESLDYFLFEQIQYRRKSQIESKKRETAERERARQEAEERRRQEEEARRAAELERQRQEQEILAREERLRAYNERIVQRQRQNPANAGRSENIRVKAMRNSLKSYVPQNAVGKLDDYKVDGQNVKGVSKITAKFEGWFGISSSKLDGRIRQHVERSLLSEEFKNEDYPVLAQRIVSATGLLDHKMFKTRNSTGPLDDSRLAGMGEIWGAMEILKMFQEGRDAEITESAWDRIAEYGGNQDICKYLNQDYIKENHPEKRKVLGMYFAARKIQDEFDIADPNPFSTKEKREFTDRINAICNNLHIVADTFMADSNFLLELESHRAASAAQQQASNMEDFNETQERMPEVIADNTIVDLQEKTEEELIQMFEASMQREGALSSVRSHVERDREKAGKKALLRGRQIEERDKKLNEDIKSAEALRFNTDRRRLITEGVLGDGSVVENWQLPRYRELFKVYMTGKGCSDYYESNGLKRVDEGFILKANETLTANIGAIDQYLGHLQKLGGKYELLFVPELRQMAMDEVIGSFEERAFDELTSEQVMNAFSEKEGMIFKTEKVLSAYHEKVSEIKLRFVRHPGLFKYLKDIAEQPDLMNVLLHGTKQEINDLLDKIDTNVDTCTRTVDRICREKCREGEDVKAISSTICNILRGTLLKGQVETVAELTYHTLACQDMMYAQGVDKNADEKYKLKTAEDRKQEMLTLVLGETGLTRLASESDFLYDEIKKNIKATAPGGADTIEQFERLGVAERIKYFKPIRERMAAAVKYAGKYPEVFTIHDQPGQTLVRSMMLGAISGEISGSWAMRSFVRAEIVKSEKRSEITKRSDEIMALGENWQSRRVAVDYFRQKKSSFTDDKIRSISRIKRIRDMEDKAKEFGDEAPESYYEFFAREHTIATYENGKKEDPSAKLYKEWTKYLDQWADSVRDKAKKEERKQFVKELKAENSYGLEKYLPDVVNALGNDIHDLKNADYGKKLQKVGETIFRRRELLRREFAINNTPYNMREGIEKNLESRFAADEKEKDYVAYIKKVLKGCTLRHRDEDKDKLRMYVERKDTRLNTLSHRDGGVLSPLVPYLIEDKNILARILADKDEDYQPFINALAERVGPIMELLTTPKSAFYSFIDQYLLAFNKEIIYNGDFDISVAKPAFEDYYIKLSDHEIDKGKTYSSLYNAKMKKLKDKDGKPLPISEAGNILTLISLYAGAAAIFDDTLVAMYTERYLANKKILDDAVAGALTDESKQRAFEVSVLMEEREHLLTDKPEDYAQAIGERVRVMYDLAQKNFEGAAAVTELSERIRTYSQENIAERKRQGRAALEEERKKFAVQREWMRKGISPLSLEKKKELSEEQREAVARDITRKMDEFIDDGFEKEYIDILKDDRIRQDTEMFFRVMAEKGYRFNTVDMLNAVDLFKLKTLLPADGFLNEFASDVITQAIYNMHRGGDVRSQLIIASEALSRRIAFVSTLDKALKESGVVSNDYEFFKLRKGFYEYYATEFTVDAAKGIIDEESLWQRVTEWITESTDKTELEYMADDRGAYYAISSETNQFLQADPAALQKNAELTKRLRKESKNEIVKKILDMDHEDRTYFYMLLESSSEAQVTGDTGNASLDGVRSLAGMKRRDIQISNMRDSYLENKPFGFLPDYENVENLIFRNLSEVAEGVLTDFHLEGLIKTFEPLNAELLERTYNVFVADQKRKLLKNRNLDTLNNMNEETQRVVNASRTEKKNKIELPNLDAVQDKASFFEELRRMAAKDGRQKSLDELSKLPSAKMHIALIALSDRNVLDSSFIPGETGVVDQKKRDSLDLLKRNNLGQMFSDEPAGAFLYQKALSSLCSYQIRDDRSLTDGISMGDLVDRKTRLDYDLLKKALDFVNR